MSNKQLLLVNDVSILFDLLDLDLLDSYIQLKHKLIITPQILSEIKNESQKLKINQYIEETKISIDKFGTFESINQLFEKYNGLSFADCSVLESAIRNRGIIISSDKLLRRISQINDVEVKGLIWIFEVLLANNLVSNLFAISKLEKYAEINKRAPLTEINYIVNKLRNFKNQ
jgi:hypothetical protein